MRKRLVALFVVLAMALMMGYSLADTGTVKAADSNVISFTVTYKQTEARKMAEMLNDFRAKNGKNEDGQAPLTYDYDLEKVAMQRAAEIAVKFDKNHIRPGGNEYEQALAECGFDISPRTYIYGENILFGTEDSMELDSAFDYLCEVEENRRLMLGYYTAVGIGHIKIQDKTDFWVQVFSNVPVYSDYVEPLDGKKSVKVKVSPSYVSSLNVDYTSGDMSVPAGSTVPVPVYTPRAKFVGSELEKELILDPLVFESNDGYVEASGGNMTGLKQGSGTISTTLLGRDFSYTVTVTAGSGKPVNPTTPTPTPTPEVTVTPTPSLEKPETTVTTTPVVTPSPEVTTTPVPTGKETETTKSLKKGTGFSTGGYEYKVLSSGKVEVMGLTKKNTSTVKIGNTVKYKGYSYKITQIADEAFKNNTSITTVKIGKNVKVIGKSAFAGCKNLKKLSISGTSISKIGSKAFSNTYAKMKITVPAKSKSDYKKLLSAAGVSSKATIS